MIVRAVRESLIRHAVPRDIVIGLSGGADSVALFRVLCSLREEMDLNLRAVYVHHGLRPQAEEETSFCQALCSDHGIPFQVVRVQVPGMGSLEAAAREVRYAALHRVMAECGAPTLALAHHQDDQAETVLMHLMYGAGADGLCGMSPYAPPLWRPLLGIRRETLREALRELDQDWREDQSNADTALSRNAIRARLLPVMEELYPACVSAIGRTAEILRAENDFLQSQCRDWLQKHAGHGRWRFFLLKPFAEAHPALRRRIIRTYAARSGIQLEFSHAESVLCLIDGNPGDTVNLPGGWHAERTSTRIHLVPPEPQNAVQWEKSLLRQLPGTNDWGDGKCRQAIAKELLERGVLRTRRPGDRITPFGMAGSMKLKDYMISRGMDRPFRRDWPLLCEGNDVLWVVGAGASERLRARQDGSGMIMAEFTGELPDHISK